MQPRSGNTNLHTHANHAADPSCIGSIGPVWLFRLHEQRSNNIGRVRTWWYNDSWLYAFFFYAW